MNLDFVETMIRWVGGLLAFAALGVLLYGVWRGARREEKVLAAEFGEQWQAYRERVPMFLPRWRR